jgi:hypothetical protein
MVVVMLPASCSIWRARPVFADAPGKLSYGSYAGFTAILNFGWWLLTIVVALMIAGNLVWLTVAFLFNSALTMGVG